MPGEPLLRVEDLELHFRTANGVVRAVDKVSFELNRNEATVILGESGSGKTSMARSILRLLPRNVAKYAGRIYLGDQDVMRLNEEQYRRQIRWLRISMVPQAAMNSLNPVLRVGDQVAEPLVTHMRMSKREALARAGHAFQQVGVPLGFLSRYAFELSGGMRQRVAIAMALVTEPDLIVLDEPTSALDVLTQANIMNVLKKIKRESNTSFVLITHDVATSSELADRVAVMYAGQIVELSSAHDFFTEPLHPYAQKLMDSVPKLREKKEPDFITGQPPSFFDMPTGCRFAPRCPACFERCDQEPPVVETPGTAQTTRRVKCWLHV